MGRGRGGYGGGGRGRGHRRGPPHQGRHGYQKGFIAPPPREVSARAAMLRILSSLGSAPATSVRNDCSKVVRVVIETQPSCQAPQVNAFEGTDVGRRAKSSREFCGASNDRDIWASHGWNKQSSAIHDGRLVLGRSAHQTT